MQTDVTLTGNKNGSAYSPPSFRDGPKDQTRNLEIPGSMLCIAPERRMIM
jgi:hypothetical protein